MVMEPILALAVMIVAGFLGGELTHRLRFPRITGYLVVGIILALVITFTRFAGKYFGTGIAARISGAPAKIRKYLGLSLLPTAGVAIGLALLAEQALPSFGAIIFNAVLVSVIINELIAPPVARYALIKSGEAAAE